MQQASLCLEPAACSSQCKRRMSLLCVDVERGNAEEVENRSFTQAK